MTLLLPGTFLVAFACFCLAGLLLARKSSSKFYRALGVFVGATAVIHWSNAMGILDDASTIFWRRLAGVGEAVQPAAVLYLGLSLLESSDQQQTNRAHLRARLVLLLAVFFAGMVWTSVVFQVRTSASGASEINLGLMGRGFYAYIIIAFTLALSQLEQLLRISRNAVRYELKFLVVGCGALASYQIYQSSQLLLIPTWHSDYVMASAMVTAISICLLVYGLVRNRMGEMAFKIYVSHRVFYGSVTLIVVSLYLLAVGILAEWIRHTRQPFHIGLSTAVTFCALVGLVMILLSRSAHAELRRIITRHFYRSKYDYRTKWLEVTEAFEGAVTEETILDRLLSILSDTFSAERISIWLRYQSDNRFHLAHSINSGSRDESLELTHPLVGMLMSQGEVQWESPLTSESLAGKMLCTPIKSAGGLVGFIALSDVAGRDPYGADDYDLLKGIAHHAGVLLSHARLANERESAAELEAFHRFAIFCLHDLKNLASRLSLVAQNAEQHGDNPVFQRSAMKTVADTAMKMMALMSKLSLTSYKKTSESAPEPVDVAEVIRETAASLQGDGAVRFDLKWQPVPAIWVVREQFKQVVLNVLLNARQSMDGGVITITMKPRDADVVLTIVDTGHGIPPSKMRRLFQPIQANRPGGLGIGLYQCKELVEANRGTIQIRSEEGRGTTVDIVLPVCKAPFQSDVTSCVTSPVIK